ncbi:MAG: OsmC family protein [Salinivirgaceae bacterium]|jgi:uncharacterized OsmC-like protein
MALLNFSINGESQNPTKFNAFADNFQVVVDEPATLGGTNHGPNPVQYILAGYAGCLNVVAHLVAKEMNIELKKVNIEINGDLNPEKLFGTSSTQRAGFQVIRANIKVDTDANQEAIDQWFKIVESRCPVNDNLLNETPIEFNVARAN